MDHIRWDDFDIVYDGILASRLKRKRFRTNIYNHSLKKRALEDHQQFGDGMEDEDYLAVLNHLKEYIESRRSRREDGYDDEEKEEDCVDPQYQMFLDRLREDGKSYVLQIVMNNNESCLTVKYEADGGSDENPPTLRKSTKVMGTGKKMGGPKDLRNIPFTDRIKTRKSMRNLVINEMGNSKKNSGNWVGGGRRNLARVEEFEPEKRVSDKCSLEVEEEVEKETDMVEEGYQTFLNCIKPEGDCIVFPFGDGRQVKYEEVDVESSDDSELLVTCNASDFDEGNYNPFETSKSFDLYMDEDYRMFIGSSGTSSHFGFRQKLMDKLRESYDHKEYEKLWQAINEQKPKAGRHRELRGLGVTKSYTKKGECSQSYIQQYTVLKRKILEAQSDRHKVLNLLRGFFFWLQNLVYKDAFPPWIDPSCLEVMPRNSASPKRFDIVEKGGVRQFCPVSL